MKTVNVTSEFCECDCENCEYSFHNFSVYVDECPYCWDYNNTYSDIEPKEWKYKVECNECWKKFIISLGLDYI